MISNLSRFACSMLTAGALVAVGPGCSETTDATPDDPAAANLSHAETSNASRALVLEAVTALFVDFDPEAAAPLLRDDYIQHNVGVPTGAQPVLDFLPALEESGLTATVHRVLADGDVVVLHSTYDNAELFGAETLVAFDVFRVQDGQLAEHWDNLQPPRAETASGRSMTDGPTEVTDLDQTEANRALIEDFTQTVLIGGAFDRLPEYIVSEPGAYQQHNPDLADGLDGLSAGFAALAEAGQAITYTKVHSIVAEGNFVFTMSEGTMGETSTAFFDLFRIEDGMIVEHWDTIDAIPPDEEMAHDNGKF